MSMSSRKQKQTRRIVPTSHYLASLANAAIGKVLPMPVEVLK